MEHREHVVKVSYALSFARHLGFLVAVFIGFFVIVGYWGDVYFGTGHLLVLCGAIAGIAASAVAAYFLLKPLMHHDDWRTK